MGTKPPNGPLLGIISCMLSVVLGLFVFGYFILMDVFGLGHFKTFESVSVSIMIIPLAFAVGGLIRRERAVFFPIFGMAIAIFILGLLISMNLLNGI